MSLIRFIQDHNRNKELKNLRKLKEEELERKETTYMNQIKYCRNCGKPASMDACFCSNCGRGFQP